MRHIVCKWCVASSLLLNLVAQAETRPQYGGTLRAASSATITSLDPADAAQMNSFARNNITALLFDTLVTLDKAGRVQPSLAVSWQASSDNRRWSLRIRPSVAFHDGSPLTAEAVAKSLRMANTAWNVFPENDSVTIQSEMPTPTMLAVLALPRNAIVKRTTDRVTLGTGPFRVTDWQPAKKLTLAANDDSWHGRPFLDTVEIELGRGYRDQIASLEADRSGLIEIPAEVSRRLAPSSHLVSFSAPMEMIGIIFSRDAEAPDELTLREALTLCLDRASLHNVLLQGSGEADGGILPDWMTGYAALLPAHADLQRARLLRQQVQAVPGWNLQYDASDPLLRLVAERISLNARDAGLAVNPVTNQGADARLVRLVFPSTDARVDLEVAAAAAGLTFPPVGNESIEELYTAEQKMLSPRRIIPLLHLPAVYAATQKLQRWEPDASGTWRLADAWLEPSTP